MKWNRKFVATSLLSIALAAVGWCISLVLGSSTSNSITNTNVSGFVTQGQNGNNTFNMQQRTRFSSKQTVNTLPKELGGVSTLDLDNIATLYLEWSVPSTAFDPHIPNGVVLYLGSRTTFPVQRNADGLAAERGEIHFQGKPYIFDRTTAHQRQEITIDNRTFIVTLSETHELDASAHIAWKPEEYVFKISEK